MEKLSAKDANTFEKICSLHRDNYSSGDFSIMVDEKFIYLSEQKMGHSRVQNFKISKKRFNVLMAFYLKEQRTYKR